MSAPQPIWISEAEVVSLMHLGEAINALELGLRLEAAGAARNMEKTHIVWGDGHTLHAIGAICEGAGVVGTKTWAHTAGGATPLLILWDQSTGRLLAIIEAFALGQMRTGSMSGLATKWLAAENATELAVIGTGKQALTQVAAVAAVRPITRVRVYSPTLNHRRAFAETLQGAGFDFDVAVVDSVEAAVSRASIITLTTRAREPFVASAMIAPDTHINAVGAISPEREEFAQDVFTRCAVFAVDNLSAVQRLSREFQRHFEDGPGDWDRVTLISELVAASAGRPQGADLTLFKAMGMGISDLSLGIELLQRARHQGIGRPMPHPERAAPRLHVLAT